jgi:hypothetical protein
MASVGTLEQIDQARGGARHRVKAGEPGSVDGDEVSSGIATLEVATGRDAITQSEACDRSWHEGQIDGGWPESATSWSATWGRDSLQSPLFSR